MATPIQNRINGHVWFRATGANVTIQLSDMVANGSVEAPINAASITQIFWTGAWTIYRGANAVFASNTGTAGHFNLAASGFSLSEWNSANVVCNTTSANATLYIQLNKESYANGTVGGLY